MSKTPQKTPNMSLSLNLNVVKGISVDNDKNVDIQSFYDKINQD